MKLNYSPIFVADDDPDDRLIINDAISQKLPETEIREFSNGQLLIEALQKLNALEHPALIIVDLNMPGKDGRMAVFSKSSWLTYEAVCSCRITGYFVAQ